MLRTQAIGAMAPSDFHPEAADRVGSGEGEPKTELIPNGGVSTLDDALAVLANPKRRIVLYYLQEHEFATVEDLSCQVAAWETGAEPDEVPSDAFERATAELVHTHLPKMAIALFIEFDDRSLIVRYTEPSLILDNVLRVVKKLDYA